MSANNNEVATHGSSVATHGSIVFQYEKIKTSVHENRVFTTYTNVNILKGDTNFLSGTKYENFTIQSELVIVGNQISTKPIINNIIPYNYSEKYEAAVERGEWDTAGETAVKIAKCENLSTLFRVKYYKLAVACFERIGSLNAHAQIVYFLYEGAENFEKSGDVTTAQSLREMAEKAFMK